MSSFSFIQSLPGGNYQQPQATITNHQHSQLPSHLMPAITATTSIHPSQLSSQLLSAFTTNIRVCSSQLPSLPSLTTSVHLLWLLSCLLLLTCTFCSTNVSIPHSLGEASVHLMMISLLPRSPPSYCPSDWCQDLATGSRACHRFSHMDWQSNDRCCLSLLAVLPMLSPAWLPGLHITVSSPHSPVCPPLCLLCSLPCSTQSTVVHHQE